MSALSSNAWTQTCTRYTVACNEALWRFGSVMDRWLTSADMAIETDGLFLGSFSFYPSLFLLDFLLALFLLHAFIQEPQAIKHTSAPTPCI